MLSSCRSGTASCPHQLGHRSCSSFSIQTTAVCNRAFWSEPSRFASRPRYELQSISQAETVLPRAVALISHPGLPGLFMNHSVLMQKNFSGSGSNALKSEVCIIPYSTQYQLKAELDHTSVRKRTRSLKHACKALQTWMDGHIWSAACGQPRITQTLLLSVRTALHLRISLGLAHTYPYLCFSSPLKHRPGSLWKEGQIHSVSTSKLLWWCIGCFKAWHVAYSCCIQ